MDLVDFVAFLSLGGLSPATKATYISGVKHRLRILGAKDFSDNFLLWITLKGVSAQPHQPDMRLPITLPVLARMLQSLPLLHNNSYEVCMYSAILTLGFHGLSRPGELTFSPHAIAVHNVHIGLCSATITLPTSKSNCSSMPQQIIARTSNIACPVTALTAYAKLRPRTSSQLFIKLNGMPVFLQDLAAMLSKLAQFLNLPPQLINPILSELGVLPVYTY